MSAGEVFVPGDGDEKVVWRRAFLQRGVGLGLSGVGLAILSSACMLLPAPPPSSRMPRVGYLSTGTREAYADVVDGFLQGLRDLGYVEGQTITIEWRFQPGESSPARWSELAAELVRLPVDVLVTANGSSPAQAAQKATSTIPIVAVNTSYPVETGLVASLARPGANITASPRSHPGYARSSCN